MMNAIDFNAWRHENLVCLVKDLLNDNANLRKMNENLGCLSKNLLNDNANLRKVNDVLVKEVADKTETEKHLRKVFKDAELYLSVGDAK